MLGGSTAERDVMRKCPPRPGPCRFSEVNFDGAQAGGSASGSIATQSYSTRVDKLDRFARVVGIAMLCKVFRGPMRTGAKVR